VAQLERNDDPTKRRLREAYLSDEASRNSSNVKAALLDEARVKREAKLLVEACRTTEAKKRASPVQALLHEYRLSSTEGVTLLSLAEALLRVRSKEGRSRLIADKLGDRKARNAQWLKGHVGVGKPVVVNAASTALAASELVVGSEQAFKSVAGDALGSLVHRVGADVVRVAVVSLMKKLGDEFVLGETIGSALKRASKMPHLAFSYDMLGEAARTRDDAERYFQAYANAVEEVGVGQRQREDQHHPAPGLSVKLSALDPRFEPGRRQDLLLSESSSSSLVEKVSELCEMAADRGLDLTIDAEEAARLELQLDVLSATSARLATSRPGWEGLGLAIQAYQKRAPAAVDWVAENVARRDKRRALRVRLVKGAYWDAEIKLAQILGLASFPVFTRKEATDCSYQAVAAKLLLEYSDCLKPAFATHNARTVAAVADIARKKPPAQDLEFQRLLGMGEDLHLAAKDVCFGDDFPKSKVVTRVYAPVGNHTELLAYLVRRLLENGANSSFVHALADDSVKAEELASDPVQLLEKKFEFTSHPAVTAPSEIFGPRRPNSRGIDLTSDIKAAALFAERASAFEEDASFFEKAAVEEEAVVLDPSTGLECGRFRPSTTSDVDVALQSAVLGQPAWCALGGAKRGTILRGAAEEVEARGAKLCSLLVAEAGKTWADAIGEVREAVDFLRYYAERAEVDLAPSIMPSVVGERNELCYKGRGVWAAIAPFNFPVAIFVGQAAGALAAGNAVVVKSAPQAPLSGAAVVECLHGAGVPKDVLFHVTGGAEVGRALVRDSRVDGVAFTGSVATARLIAKDLAARREGPLPSFIAETAGLNALVADESALPEQLVNDALRSAFVSAGQRCSSARLLFVPQQTADVVLPMLAGAARELRLGDPADLSVDCGPLVDRDAKEKVRAHVDDLLANEDVTVLAAAPDLDRSRFPHVDPANFYPPTILLLQGSLDRLPRQECFGPVLHVLTYDARAGDALAALLDQINDLGFGLTCGLHSRLDSAHAIAASKSKAGNLYINRDTVAAVVEAQPFGGTGLSGTGPKAGGPNYVRRFAHEHVVTTNTAAAGGDIDLMTRV